MLDEAALANFLSVQLGVIVGVREVRRITVGHSRAMYRVEVDNEARFVVRMEQGGVFGTSSGEEFDVMRQLSSIGYPVATVRWYEPTGSVLGQPFFVMDYLDAADGPDAEVVGAATSADFVRRLHELHSLPIDKLTSSFDVVPTTPSDATHSQIDRWARIYRAGSDTLIPLLEEGAAWLHLNAPPLEHLAVVHGDAGPGNFVHANERVIAITDWEFAHLGDPREDWSFCLTMRGVRTHSRSEWIDLFRRVAGIEMSDDQWHYWEAFNLFKGACANRTCLSVFEHGSNTAPNMAIIGTMLHQHFLRRLADMVGAQPKVRSQ